MPHQHEIAAAVSARLLDRQQIGRRLDDAELTAVPLLAAAKPAERLLRQHSAALAIADGAHGLLERRREPSTAFAILVEQMKHHSLRRLRADAGKALEGLDELTQQRRVNVGHVVKTAISIRPAAPSHP